MAPRVRKQRKSARCKLIRLIALPERRPFKGVFLLGFHLPGLACLKAKFHDRDERNVMQPCIRPVGLRPLPFLLDNVIMSSMIHISGLLSHETGLRFVDELTTRQSANLSTSCLHAAWMPQVK